MTSKQVDVLQGYRTWAPLYDPMLTEVTDGELYDRFVPTLEKKTLDVLDLGCGTGRSVRMLRKRRVRPRATGVDLSPDMLRIARKTGYFAKLHRGSICAPLPYRDAFDLVLSGLASCHLKTLTGFVRNAARALRPGGVFWVLDMHPLVFHAGPGTAVPLPDGTSMRIRTHVHELSEYLAAGRKAGLELEDLVEIKAPKGFTENRPHYGDWDGKPISFGIRWRKF